MSEVSVYVIAGMKNGEMVAPSKVGRAKGPYGRLRTLQTGSPVELGLYAYVLLPSSEAAVTVERWFHEDNKERRLHGEWFDADPRVAYSDLCYELRNYLRQAFPDENAYEDMLHWCITGMMED